MTEQEPMDQDGPVSEGRRERVADRPTPPRLPARDRLRVASMHPSGWCVGDGSTPNVGEEVFCVDGPAEVVSVLGRTGDGSRLLELQLDRGSTAPYFAAASNVLRRSEPGDEPTGVRDDLIGGSATDLIGVPRGPGEPGSGDR